VGGRRNLYRLGSRCEQGLLDLGHNESIPENNSEGLSHGKTSNPGADSTSVVGHAGPCGSARIGSAIVRGASRALSGRNSGPMAPAPMAVSDYRTK